MEDHHRGGLAVMAALAALVLPVAASADIVTITGKVVSYRTYQAGSYYGGGGNIIYWSSGHTYHSGGPVGETYTISFDDGGGVVSSLQISGPFATIAPYDNGTVSPDGGYSASSFDDGSGSFDSRAIGVTAKGFGYAYKDAGNGDDGSEDYLGFTLASVNSVPEPATWAMMLAGTAAIGWAMRRRKMAA